MKRKNADLNTVKQMNKSLVLDTIRAASPISRVQLAARTGLTKATVSNLVQELLHDDLVTEIGTGQSSGGRKPMLLLFKQDAGYAIGIELGIDYLRAALTDLQGRIIEARKWVLMATDPDTVIMQMQTAVTALAVHADTATYGIIGVGVGIPGFCDEQGDVHFAPNLGWQHVALRTRLEAAMPYPFVIDNEANAGAVGEQQLGNVGPSSCQVYVSIGTGIGTGIVVGNALFRGISGFAGEFGHVSLDMSGRPCHCGNRGCWERYASSQALLQAAAVPSTNTDRQQQMADLCQQAAAGEPTSLEACATIGHYLGLGLMNIVHALNPQRIVIGGEIAQAGPWLQPAMQAVLAERLPAHARQNLTLAFSAHGEQAVVKGASWMAITRFFERQATRA